MAHYVIADLHGEADRFHQLLTLISFSSSDVMYIIGDVIDRGPSGIQLLLEIMSTSNLVLLLGNHEYMMTQFFSPNATELDHRRWNRNGNSPTLSAFSALTSVQQSKVLAFLRQLPSHLDIAVSGQRFHLVHGFPADNLHDEVWLRPAMDTVSPLSDAQVILGHTNILSLCFPPEGREAAIASMLERGEHLKIFHGAGFLDIDCGCGYDLPLKALSCVRLEDMAEFYV